MLNLRTFCHEKLHKILASTICKPIVQKYEVFHGKKQRAKNRFAQMTFSSVLKKTKFRFGFSVQQLSIKTDNRFYNRLNWRKRCTLIRTTLLFKSLNSKAENLVQIKPLSQCISSGIWVNFFKGYHVMILVFFFEFKFLFLSLYLYLYLYLYLSICFYICKVNVIYCATNFYEKIYLGNDEHIQMK